MKLPGAVALANDLVLTKADNELHTFKFNHSKAMTALKVGQSDLIDYYEARTELFNLSLMADYDSRVSSRPHRHRQALVSNRNSQKSPRQLGGRALLAMKLDWVKPSKRTDLE